MLFRSLDEEGIATLLKKEKDVEGFSKLLDLLQTFVHPSWPLHGLDDIRYNFDCSPPYSNFLNLNSSPPHLYVPYHTCYDDVICTQEGIFVNSYWQPALFCGDAFHPRGMLFHPADTFMVLRPNKDISYLSK